MNPLPASLPTKGRIYAHVLKTEPSSLVVPLCIASPIPPIIIIIIIIGDGGLAQSEACTRSKWNKTEGEVEDPEIPTYLKH